jgi:soluble lytic murein transglycosylase-like protein
LGLLLLVGQRTLLLRAEDLIMRRSSTPVVIALLAALALAGGAGFSSSHPAITGAEYTVAAGDSLTSIARRAGVPAGDLATANHVTNPDLIIIGQELVIPGRPVVTPPPPVPAGTIRRLATASLDPTCHAPAAALAAAKSAHLSTARLPSLLKHRPKRMALRPCFVAWSATYHVPAALVEGLAWEESGWQNDVVSSAPAYGIGQLMAATVAFVGPELIGSPQNPSIPDQNIRMTARFLAFLIEQTKGDTAQAVAGYYQGLGSVRRSGPLPETRQYVSDVMYLADLFA